ncbi:ABC transporter permease [Carboxylicivirga marina]|uniref:ABC transporter permease n=1 Tax=Carboxylicivirga marina TaxID=2800988 RepID=UPI00259436CD|nr:ABC transporter permease [uncultured Carboxylicivirga sp.]
MKTIDLIKKNVVFFARFYKLIAIAILIAIAVIAGSLVIGDSVRNSLVKQVDERLGDAQTVIFAQNSFLSDQFTKHSLFESSARGILLSNGFVSHNGAMIPVIVWGVDDMQIANGDAKINQALKEDMQLKEGESLVLRLPSQGMVPSGSMFVTENYTSSLRLELNEVVGVDNGGNVSLKNEQSVPFNIFVNRDELAEAMGVPNKLNLILSDRHIRNEELEKAWNPHLSGIVVREKSMGFEITSDRIFLQNEVITTVQANNPQSNRVFSYLANSIFNDKQSIPYSFITAIDSYEGELLAADELILSDYSASRLKASVGDEVTIGFYTSSDFKTLVSDSVQLRVKKIVPLSVLKADSTLSANFPGLSNVESCTQWDSDLPIDMDLISTEDEAYWELHHSTPKAILSYEAIGEKWGNSYGSATSIRVKGSHPDLTKLNPSMFGLQVFHPRESALYAAQNGVDFAGLFMALAFFIILSAILLMVIPVSEMIIQRQQELELMKALGYTTKRIRKLLWMEALPVVLLASLAGVIAGFIYTGLIIWLLNSLWQGATHTSSLSVYPSWLTVVYGFVTGILLSLFILHRVIASKLKKEPHKRNRLRMTINAKRWLALSLSLITVCVAVYNLLFITSVSLFALTGVLLMFTFAFWLDFEISRHGRESGNYFNDYRMMWRTLYANKKQAMLSYLLLASGVFIIYSVGLNRQDFNDSDKLSEATGGYALWCESSIPVYHNLNTVYGREKLNLQDLNADGSILQCLRYSADEASCLNLNKVSAPTVLGVDMQALFNSELGLQNNIYTADKANLLEQLQSDNDSVYPALIDATVLQWSLVKNLGDTIYYTAANGQEVAVRIAGTMPNTIFQGNILMDKKLFSNIWPDISGSEVFLLDVEPNRAKQVKTLLSQALHEYGIRVTTTNNRMAQFNSVTDTYLSIFMTLGGVGILLGIMGFGIIVRKNLSVRQYEIKMNAQLGFNKKKTETLLFHENMLIPLYAIITGLISACISIGANYIHVDSSTWITAFTLEALFVLCILVFVKNVVRIEIETHYS